MNIGEKESDQPINLPIPVHPGSVPVEPAIEPIAEHIAEPVPAEQEARVEFPLIASEYIGGHENG